MPKYYKKSVLGRMVEAEAGLSDPDVSEIRLTKDEMIEMTAKQELFLRRIRALEKKLDDTNKEAERKEKEIWKMASEQLKEYKHKYDNQRQDDFSNLMKKKEQTEKALEKLQSEYSETIAELQEEKQKKENEEVRNQNLTRIMRERANQKRGIYPKKEHDGYIVLKSQQWVESFVEEVWDTKEHEEYYNNSSDKNLAKKRGYLKIVKRTENCWKSYLQTPYDAGYSLYHVENEVEKDLMQVMPDLGIDQIQMPENKGRYVDFGTDEEGYEISGMYRWYYTANYQTGLWELEIYTTHSLLVSENRRPVQKGCGQTTAKRVKTGYDYSLLLKEAGKM